MCDVVCGVECVWCSASRLDGVVECGGLVVFAVRPSASQRAQRVPTCGASQFGGLQRVPNELFIKVWDLGGPARPSPSQPRGGSMQRVPT